MFKFTRKNREYFLGKGEKIIRKELENEVSYIVNIQKKIELKNSDVLSNKLENNGTIPARVKKKVAQNKDNLRKLIAGIALEAEENDYKDVDNDLKKYKVNKLDSQKLGQLINSQKKLTLSFNSLKFTIDIFLRINERIKQEISVTKDINRQRHTSALLTNSILVYELTRFVIEYIESFELDGLKDIESIKSEMMRDIENNRAKELNEQDNLNSPSSNVSENMKKNYIKLSEDRLKVLDLIEDKWDEFMKKIGKVQNSIPEIKNLLPDLRALQRSAERQIDVLQLVTIMQVLESSFNPLQGITSIREIDLVPLTPEDARFLLGLGNVESNKIQTLDVSSSDL